MSRKFRDFLVIVLVTVICLALGEVAFRFFDNYSLRNVALVSTRPIASGAAGAEKTAWDHARRHVRAIALADGVDRTWFEQDPPRTTTTKTAPDQALTQRFWSNPGQELQSIYEWNRKFVVSRLCADQEFLAGVREISTFEPISGTDLPRYRFPQDKYLPTGLVTNSFGWRGPQIPLNRPPRSVRFAFVGASTTINTHHFPFSYPEYVGHWLNIWARSEKLPVKFDIINAGREGTNSMDFRAIVRDELLPADPDFVVYYEGSNQFWPTSFVEWPGGVLPPKPTVTFKPPSWIETHSAIGRRVALLLPALAQGSEPEKPFGKVNWPSAINEFDPDPNRLDLPLNLSTILADMQDIQLRLESINATLVPSSFVWLAYDGMRLDLPRQQVISGYLNGTFWPFPYAHIRRMADFQNRVYKKFAESRGLPYLDVSRDYPQDPELFVDAIHMNEAGVKLHAWIAFQQLVPVLRARLAKGDLPRAERQPPLTVHPAFAKAAVLNTPEDLKRDCAPAAETAWESIMAPARHVGQTLVIEGEPRSSASYVAVSERYRLPQGASVRAAGTVRQGGIILGLLDAQERWAVKRAVPPGAFRVTVGVPANGEYRIVIANNLPGRQRTNDVEVTEVGLIGLDPDTVRVALPPADAAKAQPERRLEITALEETAWETIVTPARREGQRVMIEGEPPSSAAYVAVSGRYRLPQGALVGAAGTVWQGGIELGLLDAQERWAVKTAIPPGTFRVTVQAPADGEYRIVIANNLSAGQRTNDAEVTEVGLIGLDPIVRRVGVGRPDAEPR